MVSAGTGLIKRIKRSAGASLIHTGPEEESEGNEFCGQAASLPSSSGGWSESWAQRPGPASGGGWVGSCCLWGRVSQEAG